MKSVTLPSTPIMWVQASEIEELRYCNGMRIWAESGSAHEDYWHGNSNSAVGLVPVFLPPSTLPPTGHSILPRRPTTEMEWAFRRAETTYREPDGRRMPMDPHSAFASRYHAMIEAAPKIETSEIDPSDDSAVEHALVMIEKAAKFIQDSNSVEQHMAIIRNAIKRNDAVRMFKQQQPLWNNDE